MKFIRAIGFILAFFILNRYAELFRLYGSSPEGILYVFEGGYLEIIGNPYLSLNSSDLLWAGGGILFLALLFLTKDKKKYRKGEEYGNATWGTKKERNFFIDKKFRQNVILTASELLRLGKAPIPKYNRNLNILVIGGSGSGKTRFFVKPNLMQMNSSYVVTDPKGTVLIECGKLLADHHYKIKVFDTIDFSKSMHYNPFAYIHSEKDILKLVNTLIANTQGEGEKADFWVKAEKLLYQAYIAYIWYELPEEEQNFSTLIDLLDMSETREDQEDFKNPVDILFEELEAAEPQHFAVRQYKKYKLAAGKTAKSILISCAARLAPCDIKEVRDITAYDELQLDTLGDRKSALFVIISDTDDTFNFLVSIMYTQLFNLLCEKADKKYHGRLPIQVQCLLDEFANIGQIPKFEKLIATIRSRGISAAIILQARSQLKAIYKDNADTIVGNCDTTLFLGGKEQSTLKEISEMLGKETIDTTTTSESQGGQKSSSINYQKAGKELMTVDQLAAMDGNKCICMIRGVRPFYSSKYDITKHPMYRYLSDTDTSNEFDVGTLLNSHTTITQTETFLLFDTEKEF